MAPQSSDSDKETAPSRRFPATCEEGTKGMGPILILHDMMAEASGPEVVMAWSLPGWLVHPHPGTFQADSGQTCRP